MVRVFGLVGGFVCAVCHRLLMRVRSGGARWGGVLLAAGLAVAACSGGGDGETAEPAPAEDPADESAGEPAGDGSSTEVEPSPEPAEGADGFALGVDTAAGHGEIVDALIALLPAETRGVAVVDVRGLVDDQGITELATFVDELDPSFGDFFGPLVDLGVGIDLAGSVPTTMIVHPSDPSHGPLLLGLADAVSIDEVVVTSAAVESFDVAGLEGRRTSDGNVATLLPGGALLAGSPAAVEAVIDMASKPAAPDAPAVADFLPTFDRSAYLDYAYELAGGSAASDLDVTLRDAEAVTGSFRVDDGKIAGELTFHSPTAAAFVGTFNSLNLPSTDGDPVLEAPLTLGEPVADDLERIIVPWPSGPVAPSPDEIRASRNLFKKLIAGMEAFAYAGDVADRTEPAWLDFVVRSEADGDEPPSPGSVYIRWEFRDEAARLAFEENELPEGFRIAPTQFLESDDPDGEYFFALNLYNAGGGSIVTGARAEWDVFVHGPDGADPNAGERPRFFVVEALAEEVSADPGNLLTPAEPLSHVLVDGVVVSDVARIVDGEVVPVFSSTFPAPGPGSAEVARFTREMAIGNDYIYWAHGVSDRVLYNATTFNHDAYLVDIDQLEYVDLSRWAQYLAPEAKDAVYYVNTLEYVASPMNNLDSEFLDITPEWLDSLVAFTTNGHQSGLMRTAVEQSFRGEADPFVGVEISNEVPATYLHVPIDDAAGLEAALALPDGHTLAPISLVPGAEPQHFLTLSMYEVDDSFEGIRAEWAVYVDAGNGRPPRLTVIELMAGDVAFDSYRVLNLPNVIEHDVAGSRVSTRLSSAAVELALEFDLADATRSELSLDWIEAGDIVCSLASVCDLHYYDAETLDVEVEVPAEFDLAEFDTPWNEFVDPESATVFVRSNFQEQAVKRWYDLDVVVPELPFAGLDGATHTIAGDGTLVGRTSDVADSTYAYSGDLVLDGAQVTFALDQQIVNALGVGNIFTTGTFDVASGTGTQTVIDCQGPALLCSDIENGSTAFYEAGGLSVADDGDITWGVDVVIDLGGTFGIADSTSSFTATPAG